MISSSAQLCDLGLGIYPLCASKRVCWDGCIRTCLAQNRVTPWAVAFVAVLDAIGLCGPEFEPGSEFQLSVLCLCGGTFLCGHGSTQHHSRCPGSASPGRLALDSHVPLPGSSHSFLPGPVLRAVSLLVQSDIAVDHRDPQHGAYSSSSSKTGELFASQGS